MACSPMEEVSLIDSEDESPLMHCKDGTVLTLRVSLKVHSRRALRGSSVRDIREGNMMEPEVEEKDDDRIDRP